MRATGVLRSAVLAAIALNALAGCRGERPRESSAASAGGPAAAARADAGQRDAGPPSAARIEELLARAHHARTRRDGPACLQALDQAEALAAPPARAGAYAWTRAACEFLVGQCSEGARRMTDYYIAQAGQPPRAARAEADKHGLLFCPTSIGPWYERLRRLDFQAGEAWQKNHHAWCQTLLGDLERARADAGKAIDQESRGRARRAGRLLRECVTKAGKQP